VAAAAAARLYAIMFPVVTLAVTRSIVRDWLTDHYFSGYNRGFEPVSAGWKSAIQPWLRWLLLS
jgi:hypothetical protein